MNSQATYYKSPIGWIEATGGAQGIDAIRFIAERGKQHSTHPVLQNCVQQLHEYFQGSRFEFSLPIRFQGTDFDRRVWKALQTIPYGKCVSYSDIAVQIGNPRASRAVGNANHRNPTPIVVPCHRVIRSNGHPGGYGGGVHLKKWLLQFELQNRLN